MGTVNRAIRSLRLIPAGRHAMYCQCCRNWENKQLLFGKVGNDSFGKMLQNVVAEMGIDIRNLIMDVEVPTTLAFVHTASDGDRSFSFYRNPGADMMLRDEDVNCSMIENARIFHFGSLSMTASEVESATKTAVKAAKAAGAIY